MKQIGLLAVIMLTSLLLGGGAYAMGGIVKSYSPEDFFTGQRLELARAIDRGDTKAMVELANGLDLSAEADRKMTLLAFAIMQKQFDAIRVLVELGVNPDKQYIPGIGSTVVFSMYSPDLRFLTALLDGGFPVDYKTESGTTLLQRAAGPDGSMAHVRLLIERGADVRLSDSIGRTALFQAITVLDSSIALYLLEHGADPTTNTTRGVSIAWAVHQTILDLQPGSEARLGFERLRNAMLVRGVHFPPDPPKVVRDRMKSQGLKVAE